MFHFIYICEFSPSSSDSSASGRCLSSYVLQFIHNSFKCLGWEGSGGVAPPCPPSEELQSIHSHRVDGQAVLQGRVVDLQGLFQGQLPPLAGLDDGDGLSKLIAHDGRSALRRRRSRRRQTTGQQSADNNQGKRNSRTSGVGHRVTGFEQESINGTTGLDLEPSDVLFS